MRINKIIALLVFSLLSIGLLFSQSYITVYEFNAGINREDENFIYSRVNGQNYIVDKLTRMNYQTWINSILQSVNVGTERIATGQDRNFYMNRGLEAFNKDNLYSLNDAINYFTTAISIFPNSVDFFVKRGETYHKKAGVVKNPIPVPVNTSGNTFVDYNKDLGDELLKLAYNDYTQVIRIDPNNITAYLLRGKLVRNFLENKVNTNSMDDFLEVIRLSPTNDEAYYQLGMYYRFSQTKLAMDYFNKAFQFNPRNAMACNALSGIYNDLNQMDNAINWINRAINIEPNEGGYYYTRACWYYNIKNYKQARIDVNKAIELGYQYASPFDEMIRGLGY